MDSDEFRQWGKAMVDYVADYLDNIRDRRPLSNVKPGYLREMIPESAPEQPEQWKDIMNDIERVIMPGVTHWHSPRFHAYFPTANSYPAIVADILSAGIGCIGFSWASSPACTELETVVLDWLGKILQLPDSFLAGTSGTGGGVIQGTASEATFVAMLAARTKYLKILKDKYPDKDVMEIFGNMIVYSSDQAHAMVEKNAMMAAVRCRKLESDELGSLRGSTLEKALEEDREKGLYPFFVCATLGTTNSCAFDNLIEIGPICSDNDLWMHIDAAYAGSAFVCPEFRHLLDGVEFADSFDFNPHKWLLVNFDCSTMWVKNRTELEQAFNVDPLYLKHHNQGLVTDYRHWQVPLGRRFRSLKLWFVLRSYGVKGLQEYIRKDIHLAKIFEKYVRLDDRFEISAEVILGLVCFRLKASDETNEILLKEINADGRVHLVPCKLKGRYVIRFAICARTTTQADVDYSWSVIKEIASPLMNGPLKHD